MARLPHQCLQQETRRRGWNVSNVPESRLKFTCIYALLLVLDLLKTQKIVVQQGRLLLFEIKITTFTIEKF